MMFRLPQEDQEGCLCPSISQAKCDVHFFLSPPSLVCLFEVCFLVLFSGFFGLVCFSLLTTSTSHALYFHWLPVNLFSISPVISETSCNWFSRLPSCSDCGPTDVCDFCLHSGTSCLRLCLHSSPPLWVLASWFQSLLLIALD